MSINKITFEDVRYAIEEKYILINTLLNSEQELLIKNTTSIKDETELLNKLLTGCREGMLRGCLTGSVTGGVIGSITGGALFGLINPLMIYINEKTKK